jgi:hypothetical protein
MSAHELATNDTLPCNGAVNVFAQTPTVMEPNMSRRTIQSVPMSESLALPPLSTVVGIFTRPFTETALVQPRLMDASRAIMWMGNILQHSLMLMQRTQLL